VQAHGLYQYGDALAIPMRESGELHTLQFIGADGAKRFLSGGRKQGCYFASGRPNGVLCIAEGYATAASIFEATGYAVAVAFDCGNLEPVARALRAKLPELRLILCADDDETTVGNPGLTKARAAARAVGGLVAIPDFGQDRLDGAKDFNDLALYRGAEAIGKAVKAAGALENENAPDGVAAGLEWPAPQPLIAKLAAERYPIDALPGIVRAAAEEVQAFTKAPIGLVASSALCALSLAIQAHADVKRAEGLDGPTSLFLLTIADSGERKTTCDRYFSAAIRAYEAEQAEAAKPEQQKQRAALEAWEARREGIKAQIRKRAADGETADLEGSLADLERVKPESLRVPRLIYI
jgi:putative DNA primase/helicase